MSGFTGAVQFLTRVPIRTAVAPSLTRSVPWFPVVGALVGVTLGAAVLALGEVVPMPVAGAVTVLLGVLITGAFHEDGLADVADAFAGGWDREQRFRILTDPLHGSYGVAALSGSVLLRIVCLAVLTPVTAAAALVAAHSLGRAAAVATMSILPTAKPEGLGADYTRTLRRLPAVVGVLAGVAAAALAAGWWVGPLALAAASAAVVIGWLAVRKLGGITGDVLGAVEQVAECLVLVVVTGLAAHHTVWWT
ncbi:adenosylcobinamide-GDP ribazoletransferase [soil metagenome]